MEEKISIKPEPILHIGDFQITNSYLTSVIVSLLLIALIFWYKKQLNLKSDHRSKLFYFIHFINTAIYEFTASLFGSKKTDIFFPIIASFFLFILVQNWFGLLPGVGSIYIKVIEHGQPHKYHLLRGATADLNLTLALAMFSVILTQFYGIKILGFKEYISKFINFANPIAFFTGILEIISEFSKIISFAFRLFGNIFAGEVMIAIIASLMPILMSFPFLVLEVFVGLIQALVFSMLTAVFINSAIQKHH
ncbi:MAG: ATP synthase subunit a [Patescibacteria group bacterium]|nr:MAG: ATP synthase subunit a [Patescibacteria group bacterium]